MSTSISFNELLAHPAVRQIKNDTPDFEALFTRNELLVIYSGINRSRVSSDIAGIFNTIITDKRTNGNKYLARITEIKRVNQNELMNTGHYVFYYDNRPIVEGSVNPGSGVNISESMFQQFSQEKCRIL